MTERRKLKIWDWFFLPAALLGPVAMWGGEQLVQANPWLGGAYWAYLAGAVVYLLISSAGPARKRRQLRAARGAQPVRHLVDPGTKRRRKPWRDRGFELPF